MFKFVFSELVFSGSRFRALLLPAGFKVQRSGSLNQQAKKQVRRVTGAFLWRWIAWATLRIKATLRMMGLWVNYSKHLETRPKLPKSIISSLKTTFPDSAGTWRLKCRACCSHTGTQRLEATRTCIHTYLHIQIYLLIYVIRICMCVYIYTYNYNIHIRCSQL